MAGRPKGSGTNVRMGHEQRDKIAVSRLLTNLQKHADGEIELSRSRIDVSLALLKKVLPDLSHVKVDSQTTGTMEITFVTSLPAPSIGLGNTRNKVIDHIDTERVQIEMDEIEDLLKDVD